MVGSLLDEAIPELIDLLSPAEALVSLVDCPGSDTESDSDPDEHEQEGSPGAEVLAALFNSIEDDGDVDNDGDKDDEYEKIRPMRREPKTLPFHPIPAIEGVLEHFGPTGSVSGRRLRIR